MLFYLSLTSLNWEYEIKKQLTHTNNISICSSFHLTIVLLYPASCLILQHLVGRLIGKQGRYVSFLKQTSGAKIYISTLPYTQEFQICHIEGMWVSSAFCYRFAHDLLNVCLFWCSCLFLGTQQQVDKALTLIGKKFKDLDLTNLYAPPPPPLTLPSLPMTSWVRWAHYHYVSFNKLTRGGLPPLWWIFVTSVMLGPWLCIWWSDNEKMQTSWNILETSYTPW